MRWLVLWVFQFIVLARVARWRTNRIIKAHKAKGDWDDILKESEKSEDELRGCWFMWRAFTWPTLITCVAYMAVESIGWITLMLEVTNG